MTPALREDAADEAAARIALGCPDCPDDKCAEGTRQKCPLAKPRATLARAQQA